MSGTTYQMAHIHVSIYDPKTSKAADNNHWLARLQWKSNEKVGRKAHDTRCLSIPLWQPKLTGEDAGYIDILIDSMGELQQKAAHSYVTAMLDQGKECTTIPSEIIAPATILRAWVEEQESKDDSRGKLKNTDIIAWYQTNLAATIQAAFADRKGWLKDGYEMTAEEEKKLNQLANQYGVLFGKLAAPKPDLKQEHVETLAKAIDMVDPERKDFDPIYRKVSTKIAKLIAPKEPEVELDELL